MYSLLLIMKKKNVKGQWAANKKKKKSQVATQGFVVRQWEQRRRNKRPGAPSVSRYKESLKRKYSWPHRHKSGC